VHGALDALDKLDDGKRFVADFKTDRFVHKVSDAALQRSSEFGDWCPALQAFSEVSSRPVPYAP
jgi:hypothetical protein